MYNSTRVCCIVVMIEYGHRSHRSHICVVMCVVVTIGYVV